MIDKILLLSSKIENSRDCKDILCSMSEELGELGKEVRVKYGPSYKSGDVDGILGESVDVILCAVDMIYTDNPNITVHDINQVIRRKLCKWAEKECVHVDL